MEENSKKGLKTAIGILAGSAAIYAIPEIKEYLPYIVQEFIYNPTVSDLAYTLTGRPSTSDAMQLVGGVGIFASVAGGLISILKGGSKIDKLLDKL